MIERSKILIIDDQVTIRDSIESILFNQDYSLFFAQNGCEGISAAKLLQPDVILLDVMMPDKNGFEVCREIRSLENLSAVPVLFLTALDDEDSRLTGLTAGADDFISKPINRRELLVRLSWITRLNRYRRIAEQGRELEALNQELLLSYEKTIEGWANALDLRDKETEGHSKRVTEKSIMLARLAGINEEKIAHLRRGALLHDVGKLGIPDSILLKEGPLTSQEWSVMKTHPVLAYEWISQIPFLRSALEIPYSHHEKWDGTGYPLGLRGEEIPLAARLFAIIDVWDAITSDRPYRKAMEYQEAVQYIKSQSGKHFDPELVPLLINHLDQF